MKLRGLLYALLMAGSLMAGQAMAVAVGETATFTINGHQVNGTVGSIASNGTLTVTAANGAEFTLVPQGEITVTTGAGTPAAATGPYTVSMNAAAANLVNLAGLGASGGAASGVALGGFSTTAVISAAAVVGVAAAVNQNTSGSTGTK